MATTTSTFDEKTFKETLEKAKSYFQPFSGKKNHNPYFALVEIEKLERRFSKGERTAELLNAAKAIKLTPPVVGNVPAVTEPKPTTDLPTPTIPKEEPGVDKPAVSVPPKPAAPAKAEEPVKQTAKAEQTK